jgi:hypothetical protein
MVDLVDSIRKAIAAPRGGRPVCLVCGRGLGNKDERLRLRGGAFVHRGCATYDMRRRRTGSERLGYPSR